MQIARSEEAMRHAYSHTSCRKGAILILRNDGREVVLVPARCKQWTCRTCGPKLRDRWAERIAVARPKRFITLTCDPARFASPRSAYQAMKLALPLLVSRIRKYIGPFEYCACWELHKSGYPHLHLAQKGSYVPQAFLSRTWDYLGIGSIVDIRAVHTIQGAARYVSKYITKTAAEGKAALRISRIVHASRRFFDVDLLTRSDTLHLVSEVGFTRAHAPALLDYLIRCKGYRWAADRPGYAYVLTPTDSTHSPVTMEELTLLDFY